MDLLPDRSVSRVGDVGDSDEVLGGQSLFSCGKRSVVEIDGSLKFRRHLLAREELADHCARLVLLAPKAKELICDGVLWDTKLENLVVAQEVHGVLGWRESENLHG